MKAGGLIFLFLAIFCSSSFVSAANPIGVFDGVVDSTTNTVGGWACDPDDYSANLTIHIYINDSYPDGVKIGEAVANLTGNASIGSSCGGKSKHRFLFNLSMVDFSKGHDYGVYAYGINVGAGVTTLLSGSPRTAKSKPLIGAIRWDAWYPNSKALKVLSETEWYYRIPLTSEVKWNSTSHSYYTVGGVDTQEKMDYEIDAAKRGGIDFWAISYYNQNHTYGPSYTDEEIKYFRNSTVLYLNSSKKNLVNFALIIGPSYLGNIWTTPSNYHWDTWEDRVDEFVNYFEMSNYQKTADGRPIVFMWNMVGWEDLWDAARAHSDDFGENHMETIKRKTLAAGLKRPYFVFIDLYEWGNERHFVDTYDFDAITNYGGYPAGQEIREYPYSSCIQANRDFRNSRAQGWGLEIIPPMSTGWDPRPCINNPDFYYTDRAPESWCQQATTSQISSNLGECIDFVEDNPGYSSKLKSVLIYAWNEHVEGGWIAPTNGTGYQRLDAINNTMNTKKMTYKYLSTDTTTTTTTTIPSLRVGLFKPLNNAGGGQNMSFNFSVNGTNTTYGNCTLYMNGVKNTSLVARNNTVSSFNLTRIGTGTWLWNVTCWINSSVRNGTAPRNYTVTTTTTTTTTSLPSISSCFSETSSVVRGYDITLVSGYSAGTYNITSILFEVNRSTNYSSSTNTSFLARRYLNTSAMLGVYSLKCFVKDSQNTWVSRSGSSFTVVTTTTTTTTLPDCVMPGNNLPCNSVTLTEVIDGINGWRNKIFNLGDIINLIYSWAEPGMYPPD